MKTEVEDVFNPIRGEFEKQLVATATVYRKNRQPVTFKARWKECYNSKNTIWTSRPYQMLEKTALANALRWAFPESMSGMFIQEEISEDDGGEALKIVQHEQDIEVTSKKIETEKKIIEDHVDKTGKDELIMALKVLSGDLTSGMESLDEKGKWMKTNLSVTSFDQLKQFSKKSLKRAIENLKSKKANEFTTEELPW